MWLCFGVTRLLASRLRSFWSQNAGYQSCQLWCDGAVFRVGSDKIWSSSTVDAILISSPTQ